MSATYASSSADLTSLRLRLLENGYLPIPVTAPDYPPHPNLTSPGKAPFFKGWQKVSRETIDAAIVAKWTTGIRNHTNTGLITGELLGLDIDVPVKELAAQIQQLAISMLGTTALVRIGNAPKILLCYRSETIMKKMKTSELFLPDGTKVQVEAMGNGQQVVGFGIHPDTRTSYTWPESDPTDVPLSQLPSVSGATLRAFLAAAEVVLRAAGGLPKKEPNPAAAAPQPIYINGGAGKPHSASISSGVTEKNAFFREVNKRALASIGTWFPIIFPKARQEQGTGAWRISAANLNRGLQEDISMHPVTGGRDFGTEKSCSPIDLVLQWIGTPTAQQAAFWLCERMGVAPVNLGWKEGNAKEQPAGSATAPPDPADLESFDPTEDGVALAFTAKHRGELRFDHHRGSWYHWTGKSWRQEETKLAFSWARRVCREIGRTEKNRATLAKAAAAAAVERFAQSDRAFAITSEIWDRDPFLLGTPDGTVNLKTGTIQPARIGDFITKLTAVSATAVAECPIWMKFLQDATAGDLSLVRFLQAFCGYMLTGDTREHALLFIYGPGGNGKSVFLNTVAGILADYCRTASMETFTASASDRHPTDLAMLRGARMVCASETEEGRAWAETRLKQLTGGDPVTARFMRQDFFTFTPLFKLCIIGNHKPILRNVDEAARRRLNLAPFIHKPAEPNRHLEADLRKEWPAILRWMIEGCLIWQRDGLVRPKVVLDATAEYFSEQDLVSQWIEECCDCGGTNVHDLAANLFKSWSDYALANGEKPGTAKWFSQVLIRHGAEPVKRLPGNNKARGWLRIQIKPVDTSGQWQNRGD